MIKIALALHTTTETLELAIAAIDTDGSSLMQLKHGKWVLGRELSNQIHTCLSDFMQGYNWTDITFVAIASGVGSFTSTRIGIVVARTLGEQLNIPVYAIACQDIESQAQVAGGSSAVSLLEISYQQWLQGIYSHWLTALPLYV